MGIQSHRDLIVWQKAMDLAVDVYGLCQQFPKTETYRMVDQMLLAVHQCLQTSPTGLLETQPKIMPAFWQLPKDRQWKLRRF